MNVKANLCKLTLAQRRTYTSLVSMGREEEAEAYGERCLKKLSDGGNDDEGEELFDELFSSDGEFS